MPLTDYSAEVIDHLLHPRKLGTLSEKDIDLAAERLLIGDGGQVARGDALRISLRVSAANDKILDARFQNFGTGLPIAGASCLCVLLIGKTLDEAWRVSALDLDRALNGLPELKIRKPVLALLALDNAIRKYRKLPPREKNSSGDTIVCTCYQVGAETIERAIRLQRLHSLDDVISATRAGAGCHTCHPDLEQILARCKAMNFKVHISAEDYAAAQKIHGLPPPDADERAHNPSAPSSLPSTALLRRAPDGFIYPDKSPVAEAIAKKISAPAPASKPWREMSQQERLALIEYHLEHNLRPAIHADGGDIKLLELDGCRVRVVLSGHCRSCHSAISTLKFGVEKHLREAVWPELEVEEVVEGF